MTTNFTSNWCHRLSLAGSIACLIIASIAAPAYADTLAQPTGNVLLTVTGNIAQTNSEAGAQFDYDMLQELGFVDKKIATTWTGKDSVFTGVLARKVMALVGAQGNWARAVAANDYSINLPLTDLTHYDTLLAVSQDGQRLTLRDKGPVWLLYPNDSRPEEPESTISNRMIWQLKSMRIQ